MKYDDDDKRLSPEALQMRNAIERQLFATPLLVPGRRRDRSAAIQRDYGTRPRRRRTIVIVLLAVSSALALAALLA